MCLYELRVPLLVPTLSKGGGSSWCFHVGAWAHTEHQGGPRSLYITLSDDSIVCTSRSLLLPPQNIDTQILYSKTTCLTTGNASLQGLILLS